MRGRGGPGRDEARESTDGTPEESGGAGLAFPNAAGAFDAGVSVSSTLIDHHGQPSTRPGRSARGRRGPRARFAVISMAVYGRGMGRYWPGVLVLVASSCIDIGGSDSGTPATTGAASGSSESASADSSTGSTVASEQLLCDRADECNLIAVGISVQDCVDLETMCTASLLSSQHTDWENLLAGCLDLANCMNYSSCVLELPDCAPRDAFGTDITDCDPTCDYCWIGAPEENSCPDGWNGTGDGCDCGCQFVDPDC